MEKILSIVFFILLASLLVATGVVFRKKSGTLAGFITADRSFSFFTGAVSSCTSESFAYVVIVLLALAYKGGTDGAQTAIFYGAALAAGLFLTWRFSARRLRVYSELSSNSMTIPSFLESRFKDKTPVIKVVSAAVLCLFSAVYCSFLLSAAAQLFSAVTGFSYGFGLLVCAAVVLLYIAFGGFYASAFSDLLQGFLLIIVLFFLPVYIFGSLDAVSRLSFEKEVLQTFDLFKNGENFGFNSVNAVFMAIGCFGSPILISRFIAMRDKRQIKRAKRMVVFPAVLCVLLCVVAGLFLRQFSLPETTAATVGLSLIVEDPFMYALTACALLAAILSAADGMLMLIASTAANDLYPLLRKEAPDEEKTTVARASVVVATFLICLVSLDGSADIASRFLQGFSGFAAAFAPVMFFSLYSKKITLRAAVASIFAGAISSVVLYFFRFWGGRILPFCICMALSTAVLWLFSFLDRRKMNGEILNEFERVNEIMKLRDKK